MTPLFHEHQMVWYNGQDRHCYIVSCSVKDGSFVYDLGTFVIGDDLIAIHVPERALTASTVQSTTPTADYDRAMQGI